MMEDDHGEQGRVRAAAQKRGNAGGRREEFSLCEGLVKGRPHIRLRYESDMRSVS